MPVRLQGVLLSPILCCRRAVVIRSAAALQLTVPSSCLCRFLLTICSSCCYWHLTAIDMLATAPMLLLLVHLQLQGLHVAGQVGLHTLLMEELLLQGGQLHTDTAAVQAESGMEGCTA